MSSDHGRPEPDARELIDTPEPAVVSTLDADGSPHLCLMWIAREGDDLLMSTMSRRRQYRNLRRDPRATVLIYSRARPRRYVQVRGRAELGGDGADELIAVLTRAYLGVERSESVDPGERALVRIIPEHVGMHA